MDAELGVCCYLVYAVTQCMPYLEFAGSWHGEIERNDFTLCSRIIENCEHERELGNEDGKDMEDMRECGKSVIQLTWMDIWYFLSVFCPTGFAIGPATLEMDIWPGHENIFMFQFPMMIALVCSYCSLSCCPLSHCLRSWHWVIPLYLTMR